MEEELEFGQPVQVTWYAQGARVERDESGAWGDLSRSLGFFVERDGKSLTIAQTLSPVDPGEGLLTIPNEQVLAVQDFAL